MRFKGLDLNLLVAFDALLQTRSVSRAAERMGLSQAAMSSALGRLRDYFGNEILVVQGKRMYPTAYAESLLPHVQECMRQIDTLIVSSPTFDPATSRRSFRIVASDYVTAVVVAPLVERWTRIAPNLRIEVLLPHDQSQQLMEEGRIDLLITPEDYVSPDLPTELLYEEQHVVAGWKHNPMFSSPISEETFFSAAHVGVTIGHQGTASFSDRHMEMLGKKRHIDVVAASFSMVPWLLRGSNRLAIMHERLARAMAEPFSLAFAPLPFELPPLRELVQYHWARANDEALLWLRGELQHVVSCTRSN